MSSCKIRIPFTPKAKGSWRLGKYGQYNPSCKGMKKTREYVKKQLKDKTFPWMTGPLLVIVHFRIPAPLALSNRKRSLQHGFPHIKRPDGDNLEKFLNDALNGIIWDDDSKIAWLLRSKSITEAKEGETVIFVRELKNEAADYPQIIGDITEHIPLGAA